MIFLSIGFRYLVMITVFEHVVLLLYQDNHFKQVRVINTMVIFNLVPQVFRRSGNIVQWN